MEGKLDGVVERSMYLARVLKVLDTPPVKVITGMRRVGKSTILRSVAATLEHNGVPSGNILSYNFESMSLAPLRSADALYQDVLRRAGQLNGRVYLLLDEIQEVAGWERAVASFKVDLDCDVVVTGSSATLLASELATRLAGRYIEIRIWPLSFREFLDFGRAAEPAPGAGENDPASAAPGAPIWDYLRFGGLPGVFELPPDGEVREAHLRDVFNSVLLRDVVSGTDCVTWTYLAASWPSWLQTWATPSQPILCPASSSPRAVGWARRRFIATSGIFRKPSRRIR
ncbi:MAG: AAA family ATPase [Bifidobacteriaceae bacterium]|jgi:predicted AAA+ superfamily ATPase|nr:AAA family ATPase [Bifidobacteriaceae bacterium]